MNPPPHPQEASPVVYTAVQPPPMGSIVMLTVFGGLGFLLAMADPWSVWPLLGISVVMLMVAAFLFAKLAARKGAMVRRFAPYRMLSERGAEGSPLSLGAVYRVDDHVGSVVADMWLALPGRIVSESTSGDYWARLRARLEAVGLPLPRTIADDRLTASLRPIALTSDLLEPEPVIGAPTQTRVLPVLSVLCYGVALYCLIQGYAMPALTFSLNGTVFLMLSGFGRRVARRISWEHKAPIAGCGVLKTPENRRWTCDDAVMVVQAPLGARGVHVMLLGIAGVYRTTFASVKDPDFETLWKRWNHLDPKPALLE